jgi:hypothetical protein
MMLHDSGQSRRHRLRDADQAVAQELWRTLPDIGAAQEVVERRLLLRSCESLHRQPHIVDEQGRDALMARDLLREQRLAGARAADDE